MHQYAFVATVGSSAAPQSATATAAVEESRQLPPARTRIHALIPGSHGKPY